MSRIRNWAVTMAAAAMIPAAWAQQTIKIGALNPYSGPLALYGTEVTRGYELAAEKVNAAGGVLGKKIELVRGDVSTPQQGIATVEQLVSRDKVDAFIGTYISAISLTASDSAMRYNKLYWETNAVAQSLTERGLPNFIRSGPDGAAFAKTSAETVRELIAPALKKDVKDLKVWIQSEDSIYGTSIAAGQKKLLEAAGAKVVGVGTHASKSIDLNDSVLRAKQAAPDVVLQTGYVPDVNLMLRTFREQGFKPPAIVIVGTGDTPETLQSIGKEYLEGIVIVGYPRYDISETFGPGNRAYLAAYKAKFKSDPVAPQGMAAYSGFMLMVEAIKAAGSVDIEKVQAAAAKMNLPEGSTPSGFGAQFDKNFQNTRALFTASQWQGGQVVTVFPKTAVLPGVALKPLARP
jgi:branched-chain amino acid transport system substrate-binding protein